jgi:tetratricopeptide (TPR) repeat protein
MCFGTCCGSTIASNEANSQPTCRYLHHCGLYATASPYFALAIDIYSQEHDLNLTKLASLEGTLGTISRNSDNAADAVQHFRREISLYAEAVSKGMIKAHDEKVAGAYEHMALATQQLGQYDEAFCVA